MCAELQKSTDVLCSAVQDPILSVRVSAASALANLVDALQQQQQQQQLRPQLVPCLSKIAAGDSTTSTHQTTKLQPVSLQQTHAQ